MISEIRAQIDESSDRLAERLFFLLGKLDPSDELPESSWSALSRRERSFYNLIVADLSRFNEDWAILSNMACNDCVAREPKG